MSEMVVRVENTAGSPVQTTLFPAGSTFYGACLSDAAGVVAANNFASLFNPIGSGKRMVLIVASVSSYAVAQSIAADGMTATRITAASGGTDSSAAIVPFLASAAAPVGQLRTNNPTVTTTGGPFVSCPPAIAGTGGGAGAVTSTVVPGGAAFTLMPGEGIVIKTLSGDVDQRWTISFVWGEVAN